MKGILSLLKMKSRSGKVGEEHTDSVLFSTAFAGQGVDESMLVPWEARAVEVGADAAPAPAAEQTTGITAGMVVVGMVTLAGLAFALYKAI